MSLQTIITYDTAANFTFDSDEIEIVGGLATLKTLAPSGRTFFADLDSQLDADSSDGVATGTAVGAAAISSNWLSMLGGSGNDYVDWASASNFPSGNIFTVQFWVNPGFTGAPPKHQYIFSAGKDGSGNQNRVRILFLTSETWTILVWNSSAASVVSFSGSDAGRFTAGTPVHIALTVDITNGNSDFWVDGTSLFQGAGTGTRDATIIEKIRTGANLPFDNVQFPDFRIKDLQISSNLEYTTTFTPVLVGPYSIDNPPIVVNTGILTDSLEGFSESAVKPTNTNVKYDILVDSVAKYYNGAAWANVSTAGTDTNTAAEIETNKAALDISSGATIKPRAYLSSTTGISTALPTLTTNTIDFDFFASQVSIDECKVYGYVNDNGTAVSGATVKFSSEKFTISGNAIKISKTVTSSASGYFEASLPETTTPNVHVNINVTYTGADSVLQNYTLRILIPNQASAAVGDILA